MNTKFAFFDSHAHLSVENVYEDIENILQRAFSANVLGITNICVDAKSLRNGLALAEKYPQIYNAGATTPHDVESLGEKEFSLFEEAAEKKKLVAIGETGLDYYYKHSPEKLQQRFLVKYLHLATRHNLPVIFHCRDAFDDLFSITDAEYPKEQKAILHCFTGSSKEAEKVVERGWYLSLSGIVTFPKSTELREIAKFVPMEHILLETDTPYLAPKSKRGKQNEPSYIRETAEVVAKEKNISIEDLAYITWQNACRCFNIPFSK